MYSRSVYRESSGLDGFDRHRDAVVAHRKLEAWRGKLAREVADVSECLRNPGLKPVERASRILRLREDLLEFQTIRNSAHGWSDIHSVDRELLEKAEALLRRAEGSIGDCED